MIIISRFHRGTPNRTRKHFGRGRHFGIFRQPGSAICWSPHVCFTISRRMNFLAFLTRAKFITVDQTAIAAGIPATILNVLLSIKPERLFSGKIYGKQNDFKILWYSLKALETWKLFLHIQFFYIYVHYWKLDNQIKIAFFYLLYFKRSTQQHSNIWKHDGYYFD